MALLTPSEPKIDIYQGAYFGISLVFTSSATGLPIDVTNWTFKGAVKWQYCDTEPLLEFNFNMTLASEGKVIAFLSDEQTAGIAVSSQRDAVLDIFVAGDASFGFEYRFPPVIRAVATIYPASTSF